jgi:uncharacterized protein with WD repeat
VLTCAVKAAAKTDQPEEANQPVSAQKRAKALAKKLRQIDMLKKKRDEGAALDEGQIEKLAREEQLLRELKELELSNSA